MGCFTFIKVMMILFNLLIFLGGAGLLAVGIWVSVDGNSFLKVLGPFANQATQFVNVGYFCIVIGAVLVILGFFGCCGAMKESKCLLILFFSVILIIFIAEIAAAVVALVYASFAQSILQAWAEPELQNQYGNNAVVTQIWNDTMTSLNCCGFNNYTDFMNSTYYNTNRKSFPPPCCNNTTPCTLTLAQQTNVGGCYKQLLGTLKKNANVVGGVAAAIGAVELASMVVSMYLYCHMDKTGH
ncbi:tetraspanin-1-like [Paramormyrops kingsleyae]|uniref:Tetraspanin n=1 Tax=Paramormyrops kingsleyae TaxID=1676925 RepID=A0A3B3RS83_9TELE|nr:tetraspanin-1-like [Paramormyrops kingsleyae]